MNIKLFTEKTSDLDMKINTSQIQIVDDLDGVRTKIKFLSGGYIVIPVPFETILKRIRDYEKSSQA